MDWREIVDKPVELLARIGDRHVPRLLVITMGCASALTGLFFILLPAEQLQRSWSFLLDGAPPVFWGVVFLTGGAALATAGAIDHTRSGLLCFVEAVAFFALAIAATDSIEFWGARAICFVAIVLGWVCILGLFASLAPAANAALHRKP